jgi:quercetin dioxygenase-like cupin family protein
VVVSREPLVRKKEDGEVLPVLGSQVRFVCRAEATGNAWSVIECAVARDVGPPLHEHAWDEAYFVIAGQVRFVLGDDEHVVSAGDFLYIPAGTLHAFSGACDDVARVLIFDAPAHAEGFFRDASREVRDMPSDLVKVPEIGARYGIHFVPPDGGA